MSEVITANTSTENVIVTNHAYERAKERLSLNKTAFCRIATKAFSEGIQHSTTKGQLNKYITSVWGKNKSANNIRIYGEFIFLFDKHVLITVYQVPQAFRKVLKHFR